MPRGIFNWTFAEVDKFLKDRGFRVNHTKGSHYYYHGTSNGELRIVCVPFHGHKSINPRTMKSIIAQSGISYEEW